LILRKRVENRNFIVWVLTNADIAYMWEAVQIRYRYGINYHLVILRVYLALANL
jgi:hypothetical protein